MQKIVAYLSVVAMMVGAVSCKEESVKATVKTTVAANTLNTPTGSPYVLTKANGANNFETFTWTEPDFGFSGSITYKLQMVAGTKDFSVPADIVLVAGVNKVLSASISVADMNDKLLGAGLVPVVAADVKLRVVSSVGDNVPAVISNTITINVTPFPTIFPPIWGMGDGLKGWGPWTNGSTPGNEVEWQSSDYKKYSTVARLVNGGAFRWFNQQDWGPTSYNYPYFATVSSVFVNANDGDSNLKVAGATGYYKIDVDLAAKTVAATAVAEPLLYMVGDGTSAGWSWSSPIKMTYIKPGVFEATTTFISTGAFRFFPQADWGPDSYNYPYFTSVDAGFINANDGDKNLKYVGPAGAYKIRVDLNAKTVVH